MNIAIIGPPGSGKGTQAKKLAKELGILHFSIGRLIRKYAEKDPLVDRIVNQRGKYIPTGIVFEIVKKHIVDVQPSFDNILFDGYPRTVTQYKLIKDLLKEHGQVISKVIYLEVSDDEVVKRLSVRRSHKETGEIYNLLYNPPPEGTKDEDLLIREDDEADAVKARLVVYNKKTMPLISEYEKDGLLVTIDGERSIDEIQKDIVSIFN